VTSPLRHTPKGTYLHIRATPKAGRDEIVGLVVSPTGATSLAVKVTAIPDKGKANQAVIISKSSFRLSYGETARDKVIEVIANLSIVEAFLKTLSMQT
jgi:uncharacterized protein